MLHGKSPCGCVSLLLLLVTIDDHENFDVWVNLDSKFLKCHLFFLVNWEGFSPCDYTSEPTKNVANILDRVAKFHHQSCQAIVVHLNPPTLLMASTLVQNPKDLL